MEQPTVGGWTQAYCTKCREVKEHVVVAMVGTKPARVECTSCHSQHAFRAGPPGVKKERAPRSTAKSRAAAAAATPAIDIAARTAGREPHTYDPQHRYALDDVVRHPSFGVGVVLALPGAQKMEVFFDAGMKLLSHDRASAVASTLARPPKRDDEKGPTVSDAPPQKKQ